MQPSCSIPREVQRSFGMVTLPVGCFLFHYPVGSRCAPLLRQFHGSKDTVLFEVLELLVHRQSQQFPLNGILNTAIVLRLARHVLPMPPDRPTVLGLPVAGRVSGGSVPRGTLQIFRRSALHPSQPSRRFAGFPIVPERM